MTQGNPRVKRNRQNSALLNLGMSLVAAVATACSAVPLGDGQRLMVVKALANDVILPTLADSASQARAMQSVLSTFEGEPTAVSLEEARAAWTRARQPWKASAAALFGPGRDVAAAVDWFPIDRKKVDDLLASPEPVTPEGVDVLGASRRGFHTIELLLFDDPDASYDAGAALLGPEPEAARRRMFLTSLAGNVAAQLETLYASWTPGTELAAFTAPGHGMSPYPNITAAVDTVVNESITTAERVANLLAKPLGLMSGGEPRPELAESLPSDQATADLGANLRGIRDLYLGSRTGVDGLGVTVLVKERSPNLDLRLRGALTAAIDSVAAVPKPFRAALLARDPSVNAAYEAAREVKRLASTELVANLGATVKFNDNDGD
jgi:predicted lipoprotein